MDNIYIISCGKLDKRFLFSKFASSLSDTLVITKKNNSLTKKQIKFLEKKEIDVIDLDEHTDTINDNNSYLGISYGIDNYGDLLKLKNKFENLIILVSKGDFTPIKSVVSKKLEIPIANIFQLYSESSDPKNFPKRFFYIDKENSPDMIFNDLTIDQTFTIINREIRLNKITKL